MQLKNILKQYYLWGLFLYLIALLIAIFLRPISQHYLDTVFNNALASYGVTRGFNALVSIMQESSVSAGFVIEGNLAIGQVLDPLNDLLERFASLLLISLASLGIQKLLLTLTFPLSFIIAIISFIFGLAGKFLLSQWYIILSRLVQRGFFVAIFLVLFIPTMGFIGNLPLGVNNRYTNAQAIYKTTKQTLERKFQDVDSKKGGFEGLFERFDIKSLLKDFDNKAELIITNIINLIVIFIFQTLLLPIFTLFVLWKLLAAGQLFSLKDPRHQDLAP